MKFVRSTMSDCFEIRPIATSREPCCYHVCVQCGRDHMWTHPYGPSRMCARTFYLPCDSMREA